MQSLLLNYTRNYFYIYFFVMSTLKDHGKTGKIRMSSKSKNINSVTTNFREREG